MRLLFLQIKSMGLLGLLTAGILLITGPATADDGVGSGAAFNNPRGIAQDVNGDIIVADFGNANIYRVDGITGDRTLLSDNMDASQGPELGQPAGVVVIPDGRIFITDLANSAVFQIDGLTGMRTLFADLGANAAPFGIAAGVIDEEMTLIVADTGSPPGGEVTGPVLVDPDSGVVSAIPVLKNNDIFFNDPRAIAVRPGDAGNRIWLANFGGGTIIEVHPISGKRKIVSQNPSGSDPGVGSGDPLVSVTDMAVSNDGKTLFVVDLGRDELFSVDTKSGDRTVVSSNLNSRPGDGAIFASPHGIEKVESGFIISDFGYPGMLHVSDASTRSVFSFQPVDGFIQIRDINILSGGEIAAADFGSERILEVDEVTGERILLSGLKEDGSQLGTGPAFNGPVAVVNIDNDRFAVAQFQLPPGILLVDKATGNRTPLVGFGAGSGPVPAARGFTLDPTDSNRILATDFGKDAIVAVAVDTGAATIFSQDGTQGSGPAFNNPLGITVDPVTGTIYVSDISAAAIFAVDPVTGDRTTLSANSNGAQGVTFGRPFGISWIDGTLLVADAKGVIEVDPITGNRTLISSGGPLFSIRERDVITQFVSNIGGFNGIQIVEDDGTRTPFSNADTP